MPDIAPDTLDLPNKGEKGDISVTYLPQTSKADDINKLRCTDPKQYYKLVKRTLLIKNKSHIASAFSLTNADQPSIGTYLKNMFSDPQQPTKITVRKPSSKIEFNRGDIK